MLLYFSLNGQADCLKVDLWIKEMTFMAADEAIFVVLLHHEIAGFARPLSSVL
jgi:hypothetical protein